MDRHDDVRPAVTAVNGDEDPSRSGALLPLLGPWSDGYLVTDSRDIILEADGAAAALLGSSREFLCGKPFALFAADKFQRDLYERLARQRFHDNPDVFETRLGRPGAGSRDVIVLLQAVAGDEGRPAGFRLVLRDVTATRRIEKALGAERYLLDSVIDAAQAVILVLDKGGLVQRSNPYLHTISGFGPGDLHGRPWPDLLLGQEDRVAGRRMLAEARSFGLAHLGPLPLATRRGERREIAWSARGLTPGLPAEVVVLGHDVTELQEAQRQALRAERLATIGQVAAGLAHESRNALQRIQACLSLLALRLDGQAPALDLVNRAQKAQDDLHHLFEDVLGYAGAVTLARAPCELPAVWREAWADLTAVQRREGARLVEAVDAAAERAAADHFQLKRVFRNLFENALAAAPDPVRVEVCCRPAAGEAVEVRVRDNGPGFVPGQRRRLFEPFVTTKTRGSGLGLAICRRIVEAHGGQIEAGEPGPGAEIVITLPRRIP